MVHPQTKRTTTAIIMIILAFSAGYLFNHLQNQNQHNEQTVDIKGNINITQTKEDMEIKCSHDIQQTCNVQKHSSYIQSTNTPTDYTYKNNQVKIPVDKVNSATGMSMQPTIWTENTVLYKKFNGDPDNIKEGHIIRFEQDGRTALHRVKGKYTNYVVTQGDNNQTPDGRIKYENITHIAIAVIYT